MRIDEQKGYPTIRDSLFYKLLHLFDPAVDEAFLAKKRLKRRIWVQRHAACLFVNPAVVAFGVLAVGDGCVAALVAYIVQKAVVGAVDVAGFVVVDALVFLQHVRALFLYDGVG